MSVRVRLVRIPYGVKMLNSNVKLFDPLYRNGRDWMCRIAWWYYFLVNGKLKLF
jgi:hypothetical protein